MNQPRAIEVKLGYRTISMKFDTPFKTPPDYNQFTRWGAGILESVKSELKKARLDKYLSIQVCLSHYVGESNMYYNIVVSYNENHARIDPIERAFKVLCDKFSMAF